MDLKKSEEFVVLVRRSGWHGAIRAIAVTTKALSMGGNGGYSKPWKTEPDEVIEIWPVTFLGSVTEIGQWQNCPIDYWGIPKEL